MGSGLVEIETVQDIPQAFLSELKNLTNLGLRENRGKTLVFSPSEGTEVSDIISLFSGQGVKIEKALRKEASLEEMYAAILKEVEPL
jgi:hypothetical protein